MIIRKYEEKDLQQMIDIVVRQSYEETLKKLEFEMREIEYYLKAGERLYDE